MFLVNLCSQWFPRNRKIMTSRMTGMTVYETANWCVTTVSTCHWAADLVVVLAAYTGNCEWTMYVLMPRSDQTSVVCVSAVWKTFCSVRTRPGEGERLWCVRGHLWTTAEPDGLTAANETAATVALRTEHASVVCRCSADPADANASWVVPRHQSSISYRPDHAPGRLRASLCRSGSRRGAARRGPPVTLTVAKLRLALSTAQRARWLLTAAAAAGLCMSTAHGADGFYRASASPYCFTSSVRLSVMLLYCI